MIMSSGPSTLFKPPNSPQRRSTTRTKASQLSQATSKPLTPIQSHIKTLTSELTERLHDILNLNSNLHLTRPSFEGLVEGDKLKAEEVFTRLEAEETKAYEDKVKGFKDFAERELEKVFEEVSKVYLGRIERLEQTVSDMKLTIGIGATLSLSRGVCEGSRKGKEKEDFGGGFSGGIDIGQWVSMDEDEPGGDVGPSASSSTMFSSNLEEGELTEPSVSSFSIQLQIPPTEPLLSDNQARTTTPNPPRNIPRQSSCGPHLLLLNQPSRLNTLSPSTKLRATQANRNQHH